jgi:hypothetical protein
VCGIGGICCGTLHSDSSAIKVANTENSSVKIAITVDLNSFLCFSTIALPF